MDWHEQFAAAGKPDLIPLPTRELNLETPAHRLDSDQTPPPFFFIRNTGTQMRYNSTETAHDNWTLEIFGPGVVAKRTWTISELKKLEVARVTAVLECAGNGRASFRCNRPIVILDSLLLMLDAMALKFGATLSRLGWTDRWKDCRPSSFARSVRWTLLAPKRAIDGLPEQARVRMPFFPWWAGTVMWGHGAVGCVTWVGVRLGDLLRQAGIKLDVNRNGRYVGYTAHYSDDLEFRRTPGKTRRALSRGMKIEKALAPETLVAWGWIVDGEVKDLPAVHGGPLRLVVPGYPGSAWQKWIKRIKIRGCEHRGTLMDEYQIGGAVIGDSVDMPVRSVITSPCDECELPNHRDLEVRGFAWSGRVPVHKVRVSIDGGNTWQRAKLLPPADTFAWQRFTVIFKNPPAGLIEVVACAHDREGRSQPLRSPARSAANLIGYCNNTAHRVRVRIRQT